MNCVNFRFLLIDGLIKNQIAKTEKSKITITKILAQYSQLYSINLSKIFHTHKQIDQIQSHLFSKSTKYSQPLISAISHSAFLTTLHYLSSMLKHTIQFEIQSRKLHLHWVVFDLSNYHSAQLRMIREFFMRKYIWFLIFLIGYHHFHYRTFYLYSII